MCNNDYLQLPLSVILALDSVITVVGLSDNLSTFLTCVNAIILRKIKRTSNSLSHDLFYILGHRLRPNCSIIVTHVRFT